MLIRAKNKGFYGLMSFLILITASQPFFKIYQFKDFYFWSTMLGLLCLMTLLIKNRWLRLPLQLFFYLLTLHHYFPYKLAFGWTWFTVFQTNLWLTYDQMHHGKLAYFPEIMALGVILFALLIVMTLLIEYERWFFNYLLITSYLLLIVVVNKIPLGIHLIVITGAFLLLYNYKNISLFRSIQKKRPILLLTVLTLMVAGGSAYYFPLLFPKSKFFLLAQTAEIRVFFNKQGLYQSINRYGLAKSSRAGFSEQDERLGGPLMEDKTVLFTAHQTSRHYWRVETKDRYIGTGWRSLSDHGVILDPQVAVTLTNPDYLGSFGEEETIDLFFEDKSNYLPQPYGNLTIPPDTSRETTQQPEKNRINFDKRPQGLTILYQAPLYTKKELQSVGTPQLEEQEKKQTTQIPSTIPTRISDLALKLTASEATQYDKVKEIETYLRTTGGYRYSKIDTPYTPENEDYVDYFLFESKIGYCDNFSSAMVLLVRSLGIPSRWAKGFAPGEHSYDQETTSNKYTVRNGDAHSWPEVYFEGYGWIPFEPTPSFNNPILSSSNTNGENNVNESSEATDTSSSSAKKPKEQTASSSAKKEEQVAQPWYQKLFTLLPAIKYLGVGLLIFLTLILIYFLQKYWFLLYFTCYRRLFPKKFTEAYLLLLKKAEKKLYRREDEPLNSYSLRFEKEYPDFHGAFSQLTDCYERVLYGNYQQNKLDYVGLLTYNAKLLTKITTNTTDKKKN